MSIQQMRAFIVEHYANAATWANRVSKMRDNQVIAIYMRIINASPK